MQRCFKESRTKWAIYSLLFLASVHCARSVFLVNVSGMDLARYESGSESMPYQGRVAMMPVLRWAHRNGEIRKAAAFFNISLHAIHHMHPAEEFTPEKFVSMLVGVLAVIAMTTSALVFGRRRVKDMWWLPAVLTLAMLYVSYAARYEMPYWYPYDLPHYALFGIACLCLLEDASLPMFFLFLLDIPVRETSVYLIPLVLATGYARNRMKKAAMSAACMLLISIAVRMVISRRFAANSNETGVHVRNMIVSFINPLHWPQIMSALGFFVVPLLLGYRYLSRVQRCFLLGALPGVLLTLLFGIWYESRIWGEWILPASVLLSTEALAVYGRRENPLTTETNEGLVQV
ncbi:MAG: hypothetical protein WBD32_14215 [Acidobacteriaceae bacterium]